MTGTIIGIVIWWVMIKLILAVFPPTRIESTRIQWPTRDRVIPPLVDQDKLSLSKQFKELYLP